MAKRRWLLLLTAAMIAASCESPPRGDRCGVVLRKVDPGLKSAGSVGPLVNHDIGGDAVDPTGWVQEWCGTYRAHAVTGDRLEIGPKSYAFRRDGCLGPVEAYSGAVIAANAEGARVEGDFGPSPDPLVRFDSQLYFVQWGDRHYIVPRRSLARFGLAVQGKNGPDLGVESFLIKDGDETKPVTGRPRMPKGFEHLLSFQYMRSSVRTLIHTKPLGDPEQSTVVRFTVDAGRFSGVCVGMPLCVSNQLGELNIPSATVVEVRDMDSTVEMLASKEARTWFLAWGAPVWFGTPLAPKPIAGTTRIADRNRDDSEVRNLWSAEAEEYGTRAGYLQWQLDSREKGDVWAQEWAGMYSSIPGGSGYTLIVGPHRDYTFRVHCCLPPTEINFGRIESVDADGAAALSLRIDSRDMPTLRFDGEVYFVRWGKRHYAVPSRDMPRFCWEARRYQADPDRMFRVMLKQEDKKKPVAGLPVVPARFRRLLDPAPIEARVVAVKSGYAAESYQARSWTVTLDRGERAGLFKGMRLSVDGDEALVVTSTTADSAIARTDWLRSRVEWKPGDRLDWRE